MKRYKLKITYFILLLLPLFASCTDEEIFQGSGVTEGVPTTVDISVGTAANTAKTRSALLESEERKIYNLYLWVFNSSGNVECSREYSRADLIQAATDLTTSTGEVDADAPTSMGLLKNISLTTGKKTLFLLANYKSDADGLFHVEPEVLNGISKYSDLEKVRAAMTVHTLFRPNGNFLMSLTQTVTVSTATKQIEVSLKRSEAKITLNLQTIAGLTFEPGTYRLGNVPGSTFIAEEPIRLLHGMLTGWTKNHTGFRNISSSRVMPTILPLHSICPKTERSRRRLFLRLPPVIMWKGRDMI